ncbi:MAG: DUF2927 domain-containing protein [Winogradskyella sp.]|uniref:DUF2927 domain-containing protein n=1 Tax=Winogradskyella sp. TaxID=1883156 RepID=UPI00183FB9A5|nr:DUF2927 domain-containing protein [Winogradskyella sp.]MBT8245191.1 DUF2927 domain-containing protein [Winogradskyella sp.]NNK22640.1 DUF2927 domain-containing protein [Winogradskyella sp.]
MIILIILFPILALGQNKSLSHYKSYYISKKQFEEKFQKKDSLGFIVKDNDTLIKVNSLKRPKGVSVAYERKDSTFLEYYKKIAFQSIHKDSADTKPMKYWKKTIKIYFGKHISKKVKNKVVSFINEIDSRVDSLSISVVKKLENSNYIIFNNEDYQYSENISRNKASGYYIRWQNSSNRIYKGYIRINIDKLLSEKLQVQKIKEQFIGSLGWFNLSDELSCTSYFSNCHSDNKRMTELDWELLKYHYSYGICKGTTKNIFEEQHRIAKEIYSKTNHRMSFFHPY